MTTTLRDFIVSRETEIKDQIKRLRAELTDLKVAKAALDATGGQTSSAPTPSSGATIKDMIRSVLQSAQQGLTSQEILTAIDREFDRKLERTSLSPQLSRMKDDQEVSLHDGLWFLDVVHSGRDAFDQMFGEANQSAKEQEDDDSDIPF